MSTARLPSLDGRQFSLFQTEPELSKQAGAHLSAATSGRRFIQGDPTAIFIGMTPLKKHLNQAGIHSPFVVSELLDAQDWTVFEQRYAPTGRAPYAPRAMLGLILYGIMQGVSSLRALERLARVDLGAMWVTGGIAPDHANIGRFICLHETSLSNDFFETLTRTILEQSRTSTAALAGDGTVIEAACSYYKLIKEEAVRARVDKAQKQVEQASVDQKDKAQQQLERAKLCEQVFDQRKAERQRNGKSSESLAISPTEPDAVVNRQKRGRGFAPAYVPSVLANEARIIVAHGVDPTSENIVVGELLDQVGRIQSDQNRELLLDSGYFDDGVISATLERDVSLLCPPKPSTLDKVNGLYHKNQFTYDAAQDVYHCPGGQVLVRISHTKASNRTREQMLYACHACTDCPKRSDCTRSLRGRRIKRYPEDELRQALTKIMEHPKARAVFNQRKAWVEPVFSMLRQQQGLSRFRRKGLAGVQREFALHVLAYNLARAVALRLYPFFWLVIGVLHKMGTIRSSVVGMVLNQGAGSLSSSGRAGLRSVLLN